MNTQDKTHCGSCNNIIENSSCNCNYCGSIKKKISINFNDVFHVELKDTLEGKITNPNLRSKDKIREKFFFGAQQSNNGEWIEKTQIYDRDKNYYFEKIVTTTGKIIHFCEEKLSNHKGHGSDKFNK